VKEIFQENDPGNDREWHYRITNKDGQDNQYYLILKIIPSAYQLPETLYCHATLPTAASILWPDYPIL
jgi:hypothetical protein